MAAGIADRSCHDGSVVHGFDLYGGYPVRAFARSIQKLGLNIKTDESLFDWLTQAVGTHVSRHKIDLLQEAQGLSAYGPAEIVHIDATKSLTLWRLIFSEISRLIIPGRTVWMFQDFERARLPFQVYSIGYLLRFGSLIGAQRLERFTSNSISIFQRKT